MKELKCPLCKTENILYDGNKGKGDEFHCPNCDLSFFEHDLQEVKFAV